jgi:hypothetical protein
MNFLWENSTSYNYINMKSIHLVAVMAAIVWHTYTTGQSQHSLLFDGVDDYVTCGNNASLDIKGPVTIEAWLYPHSNQTQYKRIVVKEWETSYNLGVGSASNTILFGMAPDGNLANMLQTPSGVLAPLVWVHVAGTWDGATLKIFINGEEVAQKPWVNNSVTGSTYPTILGTDQNLNPLRHYYGRMEEVRIWNVARTAHELRDNMHKELDNPELETNLVAYYSFNEGSGQISADLSLNGNTAILGGTLAVEPSDPAWAGSTAPLPYYTVSNGNWGSNSRWATGQGIPSKPWSVARINHLINTDNNYSVGSVIINTMGALTIDHPMAINDVLSILSSSSGTGSLLVNNDLDYGTALIERYYAGNEWHFISPPVSNAVSGLFTGLYLQYHDETTNDYFDIIPTNIPLVPGKGYALWNPNDARADFAGNLNTGTVGSAGNLTRSGAGNSFGWNLVGNPYPSSIDWDAGTGWLKNNINNAIYIHVDAATWATYIGGIGINGGSRYIASGQGFFVSVTDNQGTYPEAGSLIMNQDITVHHNTTFFKSAPANYVRIEVSGNGWSDETVIRFIEEATTSFDPEWDAHKLFGYQSDAPQIYTVLNQPYSINALPEPQAVVAGVKAMENGIFTITATENDGIEYVFLEDLTTQKVTDLLAENYTFSYLTGTPDERFVLHFAPVAGIARDIRHDLRLYSKGDNLVLELGDIKQGEILVYNITGQLIHRTETTSGKLTFGGMKPGVYIVQVVTQNWIETRKVSVSY